MLREAPFIGKIVAAFFLGVIFVPLFMEIGEMSDSVMGDVGMIITFVLMAAYFFFCEYRLSSGNAHALRKDWPLMLALNAVPLALIVTVALNEKLPVLLGQGSAILVAGWGGAIAGAVVASRAARKRLPARS